MIYWILQQMYKYTFCRDIKHCIGICNIKWTKEQEQKAIEESYRI